MRKNSRIVLLLLSIAALLAASTLTSCSGGSQTAVTTEQSTDALTQAATEFVDTNFTEELPPSDFKGQEVIFLVNSGFWAPNDIDVDEPSPDVVQDAVYRRNRNIEDRYGFKITTVKRDDAADTAVREVQAGLHVYDAAFIGMYLAAPASLSKAFADLNTVPNLNLNKHYWDQNAREQLSIGGKLFYAVSTISTTDIQGTFIMAYNKNMAEDLAIEPLYPLVFDGRWTFDKMMELMKDVSGDISGDGKFGPEDRYGLGTQQEAYFGLYYGADERFTDKGAGDIPQLRQPTARLEAVVAKITELMQSRNYTLNSHLFLDPKEDLFPATKAFQEDRALFFLSNASTFAHLRNMTSEYGILPIPKFGETQQNYHTYVYHGATVVAVPSNLDAEQTSFAGFVLEALAAESRRLVMPAYYDTTLKVKYSRDDESSRVLDIIMGNRTYDIMYSNNYGGYRDKFQAELIKGTLQVTSFFEKNSSPAQADLQKFLEGS